MKQRVARVPDAGSYAPEALGVARELDAKVEALLAAAAGKADRVR